MLAVAPLRRERGGRGGNEGGEPRVEGGYDILCYTMLY